MSDLRALLEAPWLVLVGWSVVLSLWFTALAALALEAWRGLRWPASAAAGYRASLVSLGVALSLSLFVPLLLVVMARGAGPRATTASTRLTLRTAGASPTFDNSTPADVGRRDDRGLDVRRWAASMPADRLGGLGALWLAGAAIGLVRLLGGWFVANRLAARAAPVDDGPVREAFEQVKGQAQVGNARLAVSPDVEAPVASASGRRPCWCRAICSISCRRTVSHRSLRTSSPTSPAATTRSISRNALPKPCCSTVRPRGGLADASARRASSAATTVRSRLPAIVPSTCRR